MTTSHARSIFRTLGIAAIMLLMISSVALAAGGAQLAHRQPAPQATISWINAGGGNWSDPANWDAGVPGTGDDAVITLAGTYTVNLDVDATVNSLTLGGASGTQTLDGNNRTLTLNSTSTVNSNGVLDLNSGDLAGNGDLTVDGTLDWTGGASTISGAGALTVNGSITINAWPNPAMTLDGRTLTLSNTGTGAWTGMGMTFKNGAVFDNQGTFDIQDATAIGDYGGTGPNRFDNSGTVTKSAGSGTTRIDVAFNNTGTVEVQTGTLSFAGGYLQTAGATRLNGGDLSSTQTLDIQGGVLDGAGTVNSAVSSAGQVSPGLAASGVLTITGDYTQLVTGTLDIEIGGLAPGTDFDQLRVAGNASLDGTLDVSLVNNFVPGLSNSFLILDGSSTGNFSATNLPELPVELEWQVSYASVTLNVVEAPVTVDDTAYAINYGGWYGAEDPLASGGGYRAASQRGQWLVYRTAPSSAVTLITYRGPDQGWAVVLIDGVNQGLLDLYAPAPEYQVLEEYSGLPATAHTIVVYVVGWRNPASSGTEVRVDGFVVDGVTVEETTRP